MNSKRKENLIKKLKECSNQHLFIYYDQAACNYASDQANDWDIEKYYIIKEEIEKRLEGWFND